MGMEIERKFLLKKEWKKQVQHCRPAIIRQGYLAAEAERTVRVRIKDQEGYLTIKGKSKGMSRAEYEYEIPLGDAEHLLLLCKEPLIEKNRYTLKVEGQCWELDEFFGDNTGLFLAEAELESEEQPLRIPDWVGIEVTHDKRYYNSRLSEKPYKHWLQSTKQL